MGKSRASHARTAVSPPFPKPAFINMGKFKLRFGRQGHIEWFERDLSKEASQENWLSVWATVPQTSSHPRVSGKRSIQETRAPNPGI